MTIDELQAIAARQQFVYLTIPRKSLPKGDRTRLLSRSGPWGRICTVKDNGKGYNVVAVFNCTEVSQFLEANT